MSEGELDGQLEFVDWVQYWAEPIVRRWGVEQLRRGPFSRVEERERGAYLVLLADEPDAEGMSRRAAAEFLGIELRPLFVKVSADKKSRVSWR